VANRKISQLTALTTPAAGDYLPIVDISEAADADKNKRITIEELLRGAPDGTAAAPSIAFESDPDTGIYRPSANQLAISTGGTERMRLDSSGRLGLGNSSPSEQLDIVNTSGVALRLQGAATDRSKWRINVTDDGSNGLFQIDDFSGGSYSTNVTITQAGNVGIGTASPSEPLEVAGNIFINTSQSYTKFLANNTGESGLLAIDADSNERAGINFQGVSSNQSTAITFSTSETASTMLERMRIDTDGNVGIGTTSPGAPLAISGSNPNGVSVLLYNGVSTANPTIVSNNASTSTLKIKGGAPASGSNQGGQIDLVGGAAAADAGAIILRAGIGTGEQGEKARIDSSGRLLVGTSTSIAGATLQVAGTLGGLLEISRFQAGNAGPFISTYKSRGATVGTNTAVVADDLLGGIQFHGAEGSGYQAAANIRAFVESGTISSTSMPGRLVFSSTPSGSATPVERMRITSDAYVRLASGTGGIQFNGDTAAANALDDYEEGTFTPTVRGTITAGTGTYTTQTGKYTKVGNLVTVTVQLTWTAHTGSGSINIQPLPFTASGATVTCALYPVNLTYNDYIAGRVISGQAVMYPYSFTSGSSISLVSLVSAGTLDFTATYYTS
jgi:hypothetical protein